MTMTYDGAPRPITEPEAQTIAAGEYAWRRRERGGAILLHRGGDGGMHSAGTVDTATQAAAWLRAKRDDLVRRLLAGECSHTCFYDRARDRYWLG